MPAVQKLALIDPVGVLFSRCIMRCIRTALSATDHPASLSQSPTARIRQPFRGQQHQEALDSEPVTCGVSSGLHASAPGDHAAEPDARRQAIRGLYRENVPVAADRLPGEWREAHILPAVLRLLPVLCGKRLIPRSRPTGSPSTPMHPRLLMVHAAQERLPTGRSLPRRQTATAGEDLEEFVQIWLWESD